jgi:hypothetical protein
MQERPTSLHADDDFGFEEGSGSDSIEILGFGTIARSKRAKTSPTTLAAPCVLHGEALRSSARGRRGLERPDRWRRPSVLRARHCFRTPKATHPLRTKHPYPAPWLPARTRTPERNRRSGTLPRREQPAWPCCISTLRPPTVECPDGLRCTAKQDAPLGSRCARFPSESMPDASRRRT